MDGKLLKSLRNRTKKYSTRTKERIKDVQIKISEDDMQFEELMESYKYLKNGKFSGHLLC